MTAVEEPRSVAALGRALRLGHPDAVRQLAALAKKVEFAPDTCIWERGAPAKRLLVLEAGEVDLTLPVPALSETKGVTVERVGEGSVLGWSAITSPFRYTLAAWTVGAVSALELQAQPLADWCEANPKSGLALYREIAHVIGGRMDSMARALGGEIEHSAKRDRRNAYP